MKEKIYSVLWLFVGNFILAFGLGAFVLNYHFTAGGVSGIGVVLQHYTGISVSSSVTMINIVLFLSGFFVLGKQFAMTTAASSVLFPVLLGFFESCPLLEGHDFSPLHASVLAGLLIGTGIGIVIRSGASTGGIDIMALIVNRKMNIPVHLALNVFDLAILLGQLPFHNLSETLYGMLTVTITSMSLKIILAWKPINWQLFFQAPWLPSFTK